MDVDSAVVKEGLAQLTIVVEVVASHDPVVVDRVDPEGETFTWELKSIFRKPDKRPLEFGIEKRSKEYTTFRKIDKQ